jgi:hypothetical protein
VPIILQKPVLKGFGALIETATLVQIEEITHDRKAKGGRFFCSLPDPSSNGQ